MYRIGCTSIVLAMLGATAWAGPGRSDGPRVALAASRTPARAAERGAVLALYRQVEAAVVDLAPRFGAAPGADAAGPAWAWPDWSGWLAGAATGLGLHDAGVVASGWLVRAVVPAVSGPPDLTALTTFPVPDHTSSGFGWRDDPIRHHPQFHAGADIRAPRGTRVYVAGDGHVIFAGRQHGYGNVVYVDHGDGLVTRYAHLSRIECRRGDDVTAATEIGRVGSTGRATGPHLHFEVRIDGRPVNPVLAMQVAELERTSPDMATLLGVALAPDVQSRWVNAEDPPRERSHHRDHERSGHRHHHPPHRSHHVS